MQSRGLQCSYFWKIGLFHHLKKTFHDKRFSSSTLSSHLGLVWLYVFSSFPPPPPRPPPQRLMPLTSKPFELHLKCLGQRIYKSWKMYWMSFPWSWPKSQLWHRLTKICLSAKKVRTTHSITTKLLFWQNVFKNLVCLFKVKHYFGHISGKVGPIDVKRIRGASVGYWA